MYLTYFIRGAVGSAPLELNLPDEVYYKVLKDLNIKIGLDGPTCHFEYSLELVTLFDVAERDILRLVYDNVFLPFRTKFHIRDVLSQEARLDVLHSGNMLPFDKGSDDAVRSSYLAASVILPRGVGGGVTTGVKRNDGNDSKSTETSLVKSTDSSLAKSTESDAKSSECSLVPSTSSEILHMGIDAAASLKLIFKEERVASPSGSPSSAKHRGSTDSPSVSTLSLDQRTLFPLTPIDESDDFIPMDVR